MYKTIVTYINGDEETFYTEHDPSNPSETQQWMFMGNNTNGHHAIVIANVRKFVFSKQTPNQEET